MPRQRIGTKIENEVIGRSSHGGDALVIRDGVGSDRIKCKRIADGGWHIKPKSHRVGAVPNVGIIEWRWQLDEGIAANVGGELDGLPEFSGLQAAARSDIREGKVLP